MERERHRGRPKERQCTPLHTVPCPVQQEKEAAQDETGTDTISGNDTVSGNDVVQPQAPGKEKKTPENMAGSKRTGKCRLCHMCPTFLGICYFIWLFLIVVAVLVVIWLLRRRKKEEEKPESGAVMR